MPQSADNALSVHQVQSACGFSLEKCALAYSFIADKGDQVLFACSATKLSSGTERLVLISRYRLLLVRWKWGRPAFRELRLLDLRGITCEGDAGAWGFGDGSGSDQATETAQIRTSRLQEAARVTLKAHALITLCLDVPPLALSLPKEWGALGFDVEGVEIDMGFSRTWLAVCSYSSGSGLAGAAASALSGGARGIGGISAIGGIGGGGGGGGSGSAGSGGGGEADAAAKELRRQRLASFMSQLISRPAKTDRVLDLTFCAEITASDFAAAAGATMDPQTRIPTCSHCACHLPGSLPGSLPRSLLAFASLSHLCLSTSTSTCASLSCVLEPFP